MSSLPQLPREPVRPEMEAADLDKEIWHPKWRCFCCEDSGVVRVRLIELIIPDYDRHRDKWVACQNPRCTQGTAHNSEQYDQRFTPGICMELDKISRQDWRRTTESNFKRLQERIKEQAREKSLRDNDRTPEEEQAIAKRHRMTTEEDWGLVAQSPAEKKWIAGWEGEV